MHEYSLVAALIERVAAEAQAHGASRIARVHVRLGELSGVDPSLLSTAYETFRERTVCDGALLSLSLSPAVWACPRCDARLERGQPLRCAACGVPARLLEGDELLLERIEMEVPDV